MPRQSLWSELVLFLRENKKWWLIPILIVFGFIALIALIVQTAPVVAPFIYPV